jgi:hypothetical protein
MLSDVPVLDGCTSFKIFQNDDPVHLGLEKHFETTENEEELDRLRGSCPHIFDNMCNTQ